MDRSVVSILVDIGKNYVLRGSFKFISPILTTFNVTSKQWHGMTRWYRKRHVSRIRLSSSIDFEGCHCSYWLRLNFPRKTRARNLNFSVILDSRAIDPK